MNCCRCWWWYWWFECGYLLHWHWHWHWNKASSLARTVDAFHQSYTLKTKDILFVTIISSSSSRTMTTRRRSARLQQQMHFGRSTSVKASSEHHALLTLPLTMETASSKEEEAITLFSNSYNNTTTTTSSNTLLHAWINHQNDTFHDFTSEEAIAIRRALLTWYRINRRKLPWRGDLPPYPKSSSSSAARIIIGDINNHNKRHKKLNHVKNQSETLTAQQEEDVNHLTCETSTTNVAFFALSKNSSTCSTNCIISAYGIWVSEIMLQQTRVEAVIPYYIKWMKSFPTVQDLANASDEQVNAHWAGLGFYRRAKYLHKGAKRVVNEFGGEVPSTVDELLRIDGIGRYTASAIASVAFNVTVPVVDGNVCRVLTRLRGIANHIKASKLKDDIGWRLAEQLVKADGGTCAGEVNQAMMELGATYCAPSGTGVDVNDPLRDFYMSTKIGKEFALEWTHFLKSRSKLSDDNNVDAFIGTKFAPENRHAERHCKVCAPEGVRTALDSIAGQFETLSSRASTNLTGVAAAIGHGAFPIAPPKKEKREENLLVAVLSLKCEDSERWLMVRRSEEGLLAGQWEFPCACLDTSDDSSSMVYGRRETSGHPVRLHGTDSRAQQVSSAKKAAVLNKVLSELSQGASKNERFIFSSARHREETPIEHIFSHVRHTMFIEHARIEIRPLLPITWSWRTSAGREVRWLSEEQMKDYGLTSGIKKVIALVKKTRKLQT